MDDGCGWTAFSHRLGQRNQWYHDGLKLDPREKDKPWDEVIGTKELFKIVKRNFIVAGVTGIAMIAGAAFLPDPYDLIAFLSLGAVMIVDFICAVEPWRRAGFF